MDYHSTALNCLTSRCLEAAKPPVHFDSEREIIDAALSILGTRAPEEEARIVHFRNTLAVEGLELSEPCLEQAGRQADFTVEGGSYEPRSIRSCSSGRRSATEPGEKK